MKPNLTVSRPAVGNPFALLLSLSLLFCNAPSFSQCWKQVSDGFNNSMALKEDGTVWVCGNILYGQSGNGMINLAPQATLQPVGTETDWAYVSAGTTEMMALKTNGTLWAWGRNQYGQLGIGNTTNQTRPVQVGTASNWASVWANGNNGMHVAGLRSDGTLWSWGGNILGQLGIGNTTNQKTPVQVGTDADWASASPSYDHTVAIKNNGTIWAWGDNTNGQLGIGNTTPHNSPVQVGSDADWVSVYAGLRFTIAIKANGTLWAWGLNTSGQLGIGNTTNQTSPVQVGTDVDWATIRAGASHVLAQKTDGTLWSWGDNQSGQLGDGTTNNRLSPAQVGTANDWIGVSAGFGGNAVMKADKTIWVWGSNGYGQLGINNRTDQTSATQSGFGTYPAVLPALTSGGGAASTLVSCESDIFGYYSYRHPIGITRKLFAIHPNGNTGTFTVVYDTSRNTNSTPLVQSNVTGATSLMGRLVTASYSGTLGAGVRVRFYYSSTDSTNTSNALSSWISANPGSTAQWQWVKYEGDAAAMAGNQTAGGFSGTYTKLTPDSTGVENGISFVEFRNITSFSTFGAVAFANTTNSTLPVTLRDLTARLQERCAAVRLDWSTDLEQNSRVFTVQRSTDGIYWKDIATIAAAGNSSVRKNYSYTDAAVGSQAKYLYRLWLNDLDGASKYSKIVIVQTNCNNGDSYLVYPNPVKELITIQTPLTGGPKVVTIYNGAGQRLVELTLKPGTVQTIPAAGWSKGLYMVVLRENGKVMGTEKLMKQ